MDVIDVIYTIFIFFLVKTKAKVCNSSHGACCVDFKMVEGICQPCFGSFGKDCAFNCTSGYYGFGCGKKCSCETDQFCDSKIGCVNNVNGKPGFQPRYGILFGVSIASGSACIVLSIFLICRRRRTTNKATSVVNDKDHEAIAFESISQPRSSMDCPMGEPNKPLQCNTNATPVSGNFSCNASKTREYSYYPDESRNQDSRESWYSSYHYPSPQATCRYDKCHDVPDKYDRMQGRVATPFMHALLPPPVRNSSKQFIIDEGVHTVSLARYHCI